MRRHKRNAPIVASMLESRPLQLMSKYRLRTTDNADRRFHHARCVVDETVCQVAWAETLTALCDSTPWPRAGVRARRRRSVTPSSLNRDRQKHRHDDSFLLNAPRLQCDFCRRTRLERLKECIAINETESQHRTTGRHPPHGITQYTQVNASVASRLVPCSQ